MCKVGCLLPQFLTKTSVLNQLFKEWVTLSTIQIAIKWRNVGRRNYMYTIQLIEIFPTDSIIQPLNNWGEELNQENIVGLAFKAFLCNSKLQFIFGRLHRIFK